MKRLFHLKTIAIVIMVFGILFWCTSALVGHLYFHVGAEGITLDDMAIRQIEHYLATVGSGGVFIGGLLLVLHLLLDLTS